MPLIRSPQDLGVILGTKMALALDCKTLEHTRRTLGWSEAKMCQFMAGKYDLKYSEFCIMAECVNLKPEELFHE